MALQQAGLKWVNDGLGGFLGGIGQANRAMQDVGDGTEGTSNKFNLLSGVVMGVASSITTFLLDAFGKASKAMIGLVTDSVGLAQNFEGMATRLKIAGTGAAAQAGIALEDLSEAALRVGGDTRLMGVSATGAAQAITDLLKAGMSVDDVMGNFNAYMEEGADLGGVLGGAIRLAAASELDMVSASNLASTSMTIFGINAQDITHAMDYIVRGADSSVASVSDIRDALEGAGPTLRGFGFTLEDSVDALSLLSNAGIKGAEAGTALRSAFTQMTSNKDKVINAFAEQGVAITDAEGNFVSFREILAQLEVATESMTEAERSNFLQTIAGAYGKTALTALINQGTEAYDKYSVSVQNAAGIEAQSAANAKTAAAAQEALKGNLETLRIRLGSVFLPVWTQVMKGVSQAVEMLGPKLEPVLATVGEMFTKVADSMGLFLDLIGEGADPMMAFDFVLRKTFGADTANQVKEVIATVVEKVGNIRTTFENVKSWIETNWPPVRDTIINVFSMVRDWIETNWPKIQEVVKTVFEAIGKIVGSVVKTIGPPIQSLIDRIKEIDIENVKKGFEIFGNIVKTVAGIIGGVLVTAIGIVSSAFAGVVNFIKSIIGSWEQMMEAFRSGDIIGGLLVAFTGVFEGIWAFISGFATSLIDFFSNLLGIDIVGIWTTNWEMLVTIIETVWANIVAAVTTWWNTLVASVTEWFTGLIETWQMNWDLLTGIVSTIGENIKKAINDWLTGIFASMGLDLNEIKTQWWQIWNDIVSIVTEIWNRIKTWIFTKFTEIKTNITTLLQEIQTFWQETWDAVSTKVNEIWDAISSYVNEKATALKDFIQNEILVPLQTFWNTTWEAIKTKVSEIWDGIVNAVGPKLAELKTKITEKIEEIKTWFGEQWQAFFDIGVNIIEAIKGGILHIVGTLIALVTEQIKKILAAVRKELGIESPSKIFFEIGENTMLGFAEGIMSGDTAALGQNMAASFVNSVNSGLRGAAAQPVMTSGMRGDVNNSRSVVVEVNANYANAQSEAGIYYDVVAALSGARI